MHDFELVFLGCVVALVGWSVWSVRRNGDRLRDRYRDSRRSGWVKDAQRFAAHPWRWSLRTALFAGLVFAASVGRIWPHDSWSFYLLVMAGAAIPGLFFNRYWFGPRIRRKYLKPPPPA